MSRRAVLCTQRKHEIKKGRGSPEGEGAARTGRRPRWIWHWRATPRPTSWKRMPSFFSCGMTSVRMGIGGLYLLTRLAVRPAHMHPSMPLVTLDSEKGLMTSPTMQICKFDLNLCEHKTVPLRPLLGSAGKSMRSLLVSNVHRLFKTDPLETKDPATFLWVPVHGSLWLQQSIGGQQEPNEDVELNAARMSGHTWMPSEPQAAYIVDVQGSLRYSPQPRLQSSRGRLLGLGTKKLQRT